MVPAGSGGCAPRRISSYSWRCTARPSCCGASRRLRLGEDRLGGRDRQRVHPAPGLLLGAAAPGGPLVEPGRDGAGGGPLEAAAGLVGGPATGGVQASRTAPAPHAGAGLRLLAGAPALGLRRNGAAHRPRAASLPGPRLQRLQGRAGLPRKPQVPRGGGTDTGRPSSSPSSPLPETPTTARRSTPTTCIALWEEMDGKTEYPMEDLVPQCTVAQAMAVSEGRRGYRYR